MAFLLRTRCSPALAKHAFRGCVRAFSISNSQLNSDKIYEMRTYTIKPERFIDYMRLTYDKLYLRTNHSKMCGFWSVDIGGTLSEAMHIWEYDSYSHRAGVRKALSQDDTWQKEYIKPFMEMAVRQENVTLKAVPWYPVQKFKSTGGIYVLYGATVKPGKLDQLAHRCQMSLDALSKHDPPEAIWFSQLGPLNKIYILNAYESIDESFRVTEAAMKNEEIRESVRDCCEFLIDEEMKILTPAQFSPWK